MCSVYQTIHAKFVSAGGPYYGCFCIDHVTTWYLEAHTSYLSVHWSRFVRMSCRWTRVSFIDAAMGNRKYIRGAWKQLKSRWCCRLANVDTSKDCRRRLMENMNVTFLEIFGLQHLGCGCGARWRWSKVCQVCEMATVNRFWHSSTYVVVTWCYGLALYWHLVVHSSLT